MLTLRNLNFGIFLILIISTSAMADQQTRDNNNNNGQIACQPCDVIPANRTAKKTQFKQLGTPQTQSIISNFYINCDRSGVPYFDCITSVTSSHEKKKCKESTDTLANNKKDFDWVTLITKLVSALAWPLTVLIIIYLLRKPLNELLPKLLRLKYKDLEVSFDKELKEAKDKADTSELPKVDKLAGYSPIVEKRDRLFELARNYPRAAIIEAWTQLEASIGNALYAHNITTYNERTSGLISYKNSAKLLFKNKPQYLSYFNSLLDLRNKAVHTDDIEIDHNKAVSFIELALRLVAYIEGIKEVTPDSIDNLVKYDFKDDDLMLQKSRISLATTIKQIIESGLNEHNLEQIQQVIIAQHNSSGCKYHVDKSNLSQHEEEINILYEYLIALLDNNKASKYRDKLVKMFEIMRHNMGSITRHIAKQT